MEWALVTPDYNPAFVADLKFLIPPDMRTWDPVQRAWIVRCDWVERAAEIAEHHFPNAEIVQVEP